jgi:cobalt/nickel transport system permease protein
VELVSIVIRGLLSVQAVILLVMTTGFYRVCRGLKRLGVPTVFTTQLLLVYRYIYVLLDEAIDMDRGRQARGYGRKGYGVKMWGTFIGQLLLRTVDRAERVHKAMLSRGFDGQIRLLTLSRWQWRDTLFVAICCAVFAVLRMYRIF